MAETTIIPLGYFNEFVPNFLSDSEVKLLFFARKPLFDRLIQRIDQEEKGSIPQHHLIVGMRGMGKTLLLLRLAIELKNTTYRKKFIGLNFSEEQFTLDCLSKLWLNVLDSLVSVLDSENRNNTAINELEHKIAIIKTIKSEAQRNEQSYNLLKKYSQTSGRRPVLLLDNLNQILGSLTEVEHSQLRQFITEPDAPILVGASSDLLKDDYQAPFYDAFDVEYLEKLDFKQSLALMVHLSEITEQSSVKSLIYQNLSRLETLHQLTGGNIRTLVILFELIGKDFSNVSIYKDLEVLVNRATPLYKAQIEDLSKQSQVILGNIAQNWNPCNLDTLRQLTNLESGTISAHLDRLQKAGWIQRLGPRKNATYEVSERFFNIWYLMRTSTQRQSRDLRWLTDFLQGWFNKKELRQIIKNQTENIDTLGEDETTHLMVMNAAIGKTSKTKKNEKLLKERLGELKHQLAFEAYENKDWEKAEKLWKEAIFNCYDPSRMWFNLAYVLKKMGRLDEAEESFQNAVLINPNDSDYWNDMGNLYMDYLYDFEKAKIAYLEAAKIDNTAIFPKSNLTFMYRDKLDNISESLSIFIDSEKLYKVDGRINDTAFLHQAIFALYDKNWGISAGYWQQALGLIAEKLPNETQDDWQRSAAVAVKLGYGQNLMELFEETGHHRKLRPFYEAIKALATPSLQAMASLKGEDYLRTQVAAEVREVALAIYAYMKKYNDT